MVVMTIYETYEPSKTILTANLAEYCKEKSTDTICLNLDPYDSVFSTYKQLNVLNVYNNVESIDLGKLIRFIIKNKDKDIIIHGGRSIFALVVNYFTNNKVISKLSKENIQLFFLSVITGGVNVLESIDEFHMLSKIPNVNLIVIHNELRGSTQVSDKKFYETKAYAHAVKLGAIFNEIDLSYSYYGKEWYITYMGKERILFNEVKNLSIKKSQISLMLWLKEMVWSFLEEVFSEDDRKRISIKDSLIEKESKEMAFNKLFE